MEKKPTVIDRKNPYEKEKEKRCPFSSKNLKCEDCRFYRKWDAQGERCLFESLLWSIQGIDLFQQAKGE